MKLGDFLNNIAGKAGKQNEQGFISLLSAQGLASIDIPDDVANAIDTSLLTIDSAKNNSTLKNHFTALALNGIDTEIINSAKQFGIDDTSDVEAEKNTFERYRKLNTKLLEKQKKLLEASGNDKSKDVEKYTKEINDLRAQVAKLSETHVPKTELEALKKSHDGQLVNMLVRQHLSGVKYANDTLDLDTNIITAQTLVNRELEQIGAILVRENDTLKLMQASHPDLVYYTAQNKDVPFSQLVDSVLASKKLIAVSSGTDGNVQQPKQAAYSTQQASVNNSDFLSAMEAAKNNLKK